ncbi:3'-5' exoribonuclease HELZ2 [Latimeria chalumnae]|uniref:3'-5' exoribonuclease HELZ2 n=1 Tax=Latimeria chalumnae TaxID=7897 RepID=UPI00313B4DB1
MADPSSKELDPNILQSVLRNMELRLVCSLCSKWENESTLTLQDLNHCCKNEVLVAQQKNDPGTKWRRIRRRPSFINPIKYECCRYYKMGRGCIRHRNQCTFAWSREEVLVWTFEKDRGLQRKDLRRLILKRQNRGKRMTAQEGCDVEAEEILSEFQGGFQEVCENCFHQRPQQIVQKGLGDGCSAWAQHRWRPLLVHIVTEASRKKQCEEIRPLPERDRLSYCKYVSTGQPCRHGAHRCNFAHSAVEMAVWQAERMAGLKRSDLLLLSSQRKQDTAGSEAPAEAQVEFYCRVCLVTFSSQETFESHCSSLEHAQMIIMDTSTEWKYRTPPNGVKGFTLCERADVCEFAHNCTGAHSREELEEWITRSKVTQRKRRAARQDGLLSYQQRLVDEYQNCSNEVLVMSEKLEGVSISCDKPLTIPSKERRSKLKWNFKVCSKETLEHVALLKREVGATFTLVGEALPKDCTHSEGKKFKKTKAATQVGVSFQSFNFGSYEQWVVFDFGTRPVLVRKLRVQVGGEEVQPQVLGSAGEVQLVRLERWHSGNRRIVPCVEKTEAELLLQKKYKPPSLSLAYQRLQTENSPITRMNYKDSMHNFLFREEAAEEEVLSRLSLQVVVSLKDMISGPVGMTFPYPGHLFVEVPIPSILTLDMDEGYLLRRAVKTALLALHPLLNNFVYEALVRHDLSSEKHLYLEVSDRCCQELGLEKGRSCSIEVQFQLDRQQFCLWHNAMDRLPDVKAVFPDFAACSIPQYDRNLSQGNRKQKSAVSFIAGRVGGIRMVPPLLIYGPFGTGKTFTLATAAIETVSQPDVRILICTHTNSAADIYVRQYLHPYVMAGHPEATPLRIKYIKRAVNTTDLDTLRYCILSEDRCSFAYPSRAELDSHRIVITTAGGASYFQLLNLPPGYFTHIMIDEAAQMLEPEALIPLTLAGNRTRIVLAGDHMQMTPKLFSLKDGVQSANFTLLNRLFHFYQKEPHQLALKSRIIFSENYRSTKGIIDFISKEFYVGKGNAILASGHIPPHPDFHPLMFCHVHGTCQMDPSSMTRFNPNEIAQVVEKVGEMLHKWPPEWGPREHRDICVLSEGSQVKIARQELRRKGLGKVTVDTLANIQGFQYRVIILTTVQTKESLQASHCTNLEFFNEARVLNTAMTRAKSQVIVVGDAVALCSFGKCSRVWKKYIQECQEHGSIYPENLSIEEIKQAVSDVERWNKSMAAEEDDSDTESWTSDTDWDLDDPILKELLDESKNVMVTVTEEGLLEIRTDNGKNFQRSQEDSYFNYPLPTLEELLERQPKSYKRCKLVKESLEKGYGITLDDCPPYRIKISGRKNCGMAFPGDEVLVEILQPTQKESGPPPLSGRVVGILKKANASRVFVCVVDEYDPHVMIPINHCITKVYTTGAKHNPNMVAIHKRCEQRYVITRYEKVKAEDKKNKLFVVEVLNWREGFYFPLGIVTEVLPVAMTLDQGVKILKLEYQISESHPNSVLKEAERCCLSNLDFTKENRKDCRDYITFTVDPKGSKDLDDAISVRDLQDCYEVGVHIADVASFVPKGSSLDAEAQKRGATYYTPTMDPLHMFPPDLSEGLFSFLPGQHRRAMSLFITVEKSTDRVVQMAFSLTLICSGRQLSYEDAEKIIHSHSRKQFDFGTLEGCIAIAYHFSRVHRKCRLAADSFYSQLDEDCSPGNQRSHQMIEEFMIMSNCSAAEFLTKKTTTKDTTPLRCQDSPTLLQLSQLKKKYNGLLPLSIHLSHHVSPETQKGQLSPNDEFRILTPLWNGLMSAAENTELYKMIDIIATDDIHPSLAPAVLEFRKLLSKSLFIRSNSAPLSKEGHYSLQVEFYTWVTSPIRRYMDLVVQRQLHAVLSKNGPKYSQGEVDLICEDFSWKNGKVLAYEKKTSSLNLAMQLKSQAVQKVAFAVEIERLGRHFKVFFAFNRDTLPDLYAVNYRALQLVEQPSYDEGQNCMKLTWRRRIYSMEANDCFLEAMAVKPIVTSVKANFWQKVLEAIKREEFKKMNDLLMAEGRSTIKQRSICNIKKKKLSDHVEVSLELSAGTPLTLQLSTNIQRGFLVPAVQLLSVAPVFDVCLEHTENPIMCFAKCAVHPSKEKYRDAVDYKRIWYPLCAMESASSAVAENDPIIIHGVVINWENRKTPNKQLMGHFILPKEYKKKWTIECDLANSYLCIRSRTLKSHVDLEDEEEHLARALESMDLSGGSMSWSQLTGDPNAYVWVAHGLAERDHSNESDSERNEDHVNFYLHYVSTDVIPMEVLQKTTTFTVEIIPKLLPDVRKESAVNNLPWASELVQSIALKREIPQQYTKLPKSQLVDQKNYSVPGNRFPPLNDSQNTAVRKAMRQVFTLIQGPPGTGKSVVGVHIVYWFCQLNKEIVEKTLPLEDKEERAEKCVLYCGPSNKSVDVLNGLLKPLRVYSEQLETVDFPLPRGKGQTSYKLLREGKAKPELRSITLHFRIRELTNPHASEIRKYDARIRAKEDFADDEVKTYKNLLRLARLYELQQHDVILCTCSAAFNPKLSRKLNVRQILIDECAMSTEPETLIPLVSHKRAEKVVLLGDHMQLRAVVQNDFCKSLGMERSLFERYTDQAFMLDTQYRMHPEICKFPSKQFYGGQLKSGDNVRRRPPSVLHHSVKPHRSCPIIFGRVDGKEVSLVVSTEEGNENSKANREEAAQAVRIAKKLTLDGTIKPEDVAILTPYNAQVFEIKKLLQKEGIPKIVVSSIMKSQGSEWRYVILSTVRSGPRSEIDKKPTKAWLKKCLGFIIDPNQVNVAITRAQEGLCILGNSFLLECSSLWKRLLGHYREHSCLVLAKEIDVSRRSAAR